MRIAVALLSVLLVLASVSCQGEQVAERLSRRGLKQQPAGTTVLYASRSPATVLAPAAGVAVDPSKLVLTPGKLITPSGPEVSDNQFIRVRTDGPSVAPSAQGMFSHQQPEYREKYQDPEHTTSFSSSTPVIDCIGGQPCGGGQVPAKIDDSFSSPKSEKKQQEKKQQQQEQQEEQQQQQQQQEDDSDVEQKLDDLLEALEGIKDTLEQQRGESTEIAEQAADKIKNDLKDKEKEIAEEGAKEAEDEDDDDN